MNECSKKSCSRAKNLALATAIRVALPLVVVGSVLGCADFTPPLVSPARGGSSWTKLTSRHFVLLTDVDATEARNLLSDFEVYYGALVDLGFPAGDLGGRTVRVVLFERRIDFRQFSMGVMDVPRARVLPNDPEHLPTIVLQGSGTKLTRSFFLHELTHYVLAKDFQSSPVWLREGLALYYSGISLDADFAYLGLTPRTHPLIAHLYSGYRRLDRHANPTSVAPLGVRDLPPASKLMRLNGEDFYRYLGESDHDRVRELCGNYAAALTLVHMLRHGDEKYRVAHASLLATFEGGKQAIDGWGDGLVDGAPSSLDRDLAAYYLRRVVPFERRIYPPRSNGYVEGPHAMSDREVRALWDGLLARK